MCVGCWVCYELKVIANELFISTVGPSLISRSSPSSNDPNTIRPSLRPLFHSFLSPTLLPPCRAWHCASPLSTAMWPDTLERRERRMATPTPGPATWGLTSLKYVGIDVFLPTPCIVWWTIVPQICCTGNQDSTKAVVLKMSEWLGISAMSKVFHTLAKWPHFPVGYIVHAKPLTKL